MRIVSIPYQVAQTVSRRHLRMIVTNKLLGDTKNTLNTNT